MTGLINSKTVFPADSDSLYYFVREGYTTDTISYAWRAEGFCKKVKLTSELLDGFA